MIHFGFIVGITATWAVAMKVATSGPILIFIAFLIASDLLGMLLIWSALRVGWRSLRAFGWPTTEGTILHQEIKGNGAADEPMYLLKVDYCYSVEGVNHKGDRVAFLHASTSNLRSQEKLQHELTAKPTVVVRYDPARPGESCLVPGLNVAWWAFFLIGLLWEGLSLVLSYFFLREMIASHWKLW